MVIVCHNLLVMAIGADVITICEASALHKEEKYGHNTLHTHTRARIKCH